MSLKIKQILITIIISIYIISCNSGPKVISSTKKTNTKKNTGIFTEDSEGSTIKSTSSSTNTSQFHKVTVNEKLLATRYIYLKVTENEEQFWIATRKQDINIGEVYFYKDGLLKTNFESKEHNKVFDKIYLVSNLVQANHSQNISSGNMSRTGKQKTNPTKKTKQKIVVKGSIKIATLIANPKKYQGKTVQISGECTKINPNIMGKNWLHLKDGSKDGYDLVITSDTFVKEGSIITIKGIVTLNKDFGAGYKYDLIIENGQIITE